MNRFGNIAVLCLVNLMWAAQYPAYKTASEHFEPAGLAFWTFLIAGLLMIPFMRRASRPRAMQWRTAGQFLVLALLGLLPPSILMAWGVAQSTAANASILALTIPVLMFVMALLLLRERLTAARFASLVLALCGTILISWREFGGRDFSTNLLAGNLTVFAAGAGSAFYNVYSKNLLERYSEAEVLVYGYGVAVVCCALLSALVDEQPFFRTAGLPAKAWVSVLILGGISWGLAMALWMWALNRLEVIQISAAVYLLPVFGVLLSAVILGDRLSAVQFAGAAVVVSSAVLATRSEVRPAEV